MSYILKNEEFDKYFQNILLDLETYLEENEMELENDIIVWLFRSDGATCFGQTVPL